MPLAFLSASSDCADLSPLLSRCSINMLQAHMVTCIAMHGPHLC